MKHATCKAPGCLAMAAALLLAAPPQPARAATPNLVRVILTADEAYEQGMGGPGVQKDFKGGVTLYDTTLIEDDGADSGWQQHSDQLFTLAGQVQKILPPE